MQRYECLNLALDPPQHVGVVAAGGVGQVREKNVCRRRGAVAHRLCGSVFVVNSVLRPFECVGGPCPV